MKKLLILLIILSACTPTPPGDKTTDAEACPELNILMGEIQSLERSLKQRKDWDELEESLTILIQQLQQNTEDSSALCMFSDHAYYPHFMRFAFIDELSVSIIKNHYPHAFPYLISLGRIFKQDKAIGEYFSEKLALIAYHNPKVWVRYYISHKEERDSLFNNTRWEITDRKRMIRRLQSVDGSEYLIERLNENNHSVRKR